MCRQIILFLFFCFCINEFANSQQAPTQTDSAKFYRDLQTFSKKRKSTNFLYRLLFKPVAEPETKKGKKKRQKNLPQLQKPYSAFEGKIIRNIHITTLDPFGYSVSDTAVPTQNSLTKTGNWLHIKSQGITIRNLLLIKRNQPFDSLLVNESERLIRSQKYVHDVAFKVVTVGKKSDSVDIFIREWDIWSIAVGASISPSAGKVNITEKNFLGFGHEFQNIYSRNLVEGIHAYNTYYFVPSIRNTYINSTLHYGVDGYGNHSRSLAVDRPFFSPFAQWAAGISLSSLFRHDSLKSNLINVPFNLKSGTQDYWAGKATRIFKGNSEDARVTNLIWTGRYLRVRYFEQPSELYDSLHMYANEDFYLAGIGISTRKYIKDNYVFNFGITEDIPAGHVYGLTGGYQVRDNIGRVYLALRYSMGNYIKWGYLGYNFEYGTFYRSSHPEQSVFKGEVNYFTDLFEIGNWKFRQFIKPQLTLGINRYPYENITINNENGIRGFNSSSLIGTKKMILTLQSQSYAPWNVLGFRFGPYLTYSLGMIGNEAAGFKRSRVYSQFGLGVLIKNDYLVFNYFQFSISFYPIIPEEGDNLFKFNQNKTTDFGFQDFILGKPSTVAYQ